MNSTAPALRRGCGTGRAWACWWRSAGVRTDTWVWDGAWTPHARADGSQVVFNGHHAQRVFVDLPSQTILVQTAVSHDGDWQSDLYSLFESAVAIKT